MGLFEEQLARKPNKYPWTEKFIEVTQAGFWTHREFSFQSDIQNFKVNLTDQEKSIIIKSLSTIGQIEIAVKLFWGNIGKNLPHSSLIDLGFVLANTEVIHGEAYERLLEVLGIENSFEEILNLKIIKNRVSYLKKHLDHFSFNDRQQFIYSLILFTIFIENISLFSQFYIVSWFNKNKNLLKDTNKQIEYTAREEFIHTLVGIKIINTLREEYPNLFNEELKEKIIKESKNAIEYECEIVNWILEDINYLDLNPTVVKEFLTNRLNWALNQIGYGTPFVTNEEEIKKTTWFDELLLSNSMTDFFNSKPVEYVQKSQSFDELF